MMQSKQTVFRTNPDALVADMRILSTSQSSIVDADKQPPGLVLTIPVVVWHPVSDDSGWSEYSEHTKHLTLEQAVELHAALGSHIAHVRAGWNSEKVAETLEHLIASGDIALDGLYYGEARYSVRGVNKKRWRGADAIAYVLDQREREANNA